MNKHTTGMLSLAIILMGSVAHAEEATDIRTVRQDLTTPRMTEEEPAPGKRVKRVAAEYKGTEVYHALYLPTDWRKGKLYPVIVEYAGNGPYRNRFGDVCTGKVADCNLGYGISGGKGFIWVCLPYISKDRKRNQLQWWGDLEATVEYCKTVVPRICREYGGDPSTVFLAGFSRGAIACNFIGLHDDQIASLWRGFICHSHYDGVRKWRYPGSDRKSAAERLRRLKNRPQFISHEVSVDETRRYLKKACPEGNFAFAALPFRNHTDSWVLRDIPQRKAVREWLQNILQGKTKQTEASRACETGRLAVHCRVHAARSPFAAGDQDEPTRGHSARICSDLLRRRLAGRRLRCA